MPKFDPIFSNPGGMASRLFNTMHVSFPGAEWDPGVPSVEAKGFADWMDTQFEQLPEEFLDRDIVKTCRNDIVRSLRSMDRASEDDMWGWAELQAEKMIESFPALANEGKDLPASQRASFQNASASVLLKVSAFFVARQRNDVSCDLIEARLQLGEETQKLGELAPDPPDDVKIEKGVTAADYLKTVTSSLPKDPLSQGFVENILSSLADREADHLNPKYLKDLASIVRKVREELINEGKKGVSDDALAVRSILIAEAMTPEYSAPDGRPRGGDPVQVRPYDAGKVNKELTIGARDVQQRVKQEIGDEEREKKEIFE